ncbi:MAG: tetratricopeptide repeat protein [Deltaproteobacteria bacterium]|nr:tetratricopeptide repeat protein [Deltaproteobacteria bacterium]
MRKLIGKRASACLGKKEYYNAIADCTRAIELDPNYADAYYVRSVAYKETGEKSKADAGLGRAIDLDPNYAIC